MKLQRPRSQPSIIMHGRVPVFFLFQNFPPIIANLERDHHLRLFVFHQWAGGRVHFLLSAQKHSEPAYFLEEYPLLFFDPLVSGPWAASEGGSGFVSPFIERSWTLLRLYA